MLSKIELALNLRRIARVLCVDHGAACCSCRWGASGMAGNKTVAIDEHKGALHYSSGCPELRLAADVISMLDDATYDALTNKGMNR